MKLIFPVWKVSSESMEKYLLTSKQKGFLTVLHSFFRYELVSTPCCID